MIKRQQSSARLIRKGTSRSQSQALGRQRTELHRRWLTLSPLALRQDMGEALPEAPDEDTSRISDELLADAAETSPDGAEIEESTQDLTESATVELDAGETPPALDALIDMADHYVLRVITEGERAWVRFVEPDWMVEYRHDRGARGDYLRTTRDRLNQLAVWLESNVQPFLLAPSLESWVSSYTSHQVALVDVQSLALAVKVEGETKELANAYARLLDHLLMVWPGRTCLDLKAALENKRYKIAIAAANILPKAKPKPEKWLELRNIQPAPPGKFPSNTVNANESIHYWAKKLRVKPDDILGALQEMLRRDTKHDE